VGLNYNNVILSESEESLSHQARLFSHKERSFRVAYTKGYTTCIINLFPVNGRFVN